MRRLLFVLAATFGVFAAVSYGAAPAGSVSSSSAFELSGVHVPVEGVSNWPVLVGDEVATVDSGATVHLKDGSRAVLSVRTRARVEEVDGRLTMRLLSGALEMVNRAEQEFTSRPGARRPVTPRPTPPPHAPRPTSRR